MHASVILCSINSISLMEGYDPMHCPYFWPPSFCQYSSCQFAQRFCQALSTSLQYPCWQKVWACSTVLAETLQNFLGYLLLHVGNGLLSSVGWHFYFCILICFSVFYFILGFKGFCKVAGFSTARWSQPVDRRCRRLRHRKRKWLRRRGLLERS